MFEKRLLSGLTVIRYIMRMHFQYKESYFASREQHSQSKGCPPVGAWLAYPVQANGVYGGIQ